MRTVSPSTVERLVTRFDHHNPNFEPDTAQAVHRRLRDQCPVAHTTAHGGAWVLSRYCDVRATLKDHRTFRSGSGVFFPRAVGTPYFAPLEYDPPQHGRFRALVQPAFTKDAVRWLEPEIRRLVSAHLHPLVDQGGGDILKQLATPLPLAVLSLAVGFSDDAHRSISELTSNTWKHMPADDGLDKFWPQFARLLDHEIDTALTEPRDTYLCGLVRQHVAGHLTRPELRAILLTLAIGGHETTVNAISHLVWLLARRPDIVAHARSQPDQIDQIIDESLRLWPPADHGTRLAAKTVRVCDKEIPEGSRIIMLTGAANRDPDQFSAPEEFHLDRSGRSHLSFGYGIHFCLGAHLARLELKTLLSELVRLPDFELAADPVRKYENGRHLRFEKLAVRIV
jgi:cytochrome P450